MAFEFKDIIANKIIKYTAPGPEYKSHNHHIFSTKQLELIFQHLNFSFPLEFSCKNQEDICYQEEMESRLDDVALGAKHRDPRALVEGEHLAGELLPGGRHARHLVPDTPVGRAHRSVRFRRSVGRTPSR